MEQTRASPAASQTVAEAFLAMDLGSGPRTFPLHAGVICRIGRDDHSSIVLAGEQVSRRHAMVECTPTGEYYLIDLGSRNGTLVNGRRVATPVLLHPGDRITIGSHEIVFNTQADLPGKPRLRDETVANIMQRLITVLVTDVRDFTGMCRRNGEVRVSSMISTFFRQCGAALTEHGAWSQKYIGDAVMAIWVHRQNVPELQEIVAVFEALAREFEIAEGLAAQFGLDVQVRISAGINTGPACVGNLGSDMSSDYTATSDAVNLSFRLESATRQIDCDVALGPTTYRALTEQAALAPLFEPHPVILKGYREAVSVYAANRAAVCALLEICAPGPRTPGTSPNSLIS